MSLVPQHAYHALAIDEQRVDFAPSVWNKKRAGQVLEQVWFPGVHTNVGGGYADNGLANTALWWMVDKALARGIEVNSTYLRHFEPDAAGKIYRSRKGFYRLKKPHLRTLGSGMNERLHDCVPLREQALADYRPTNVQAFRAQGGQ